jgi:hypothetical protein
VVRGSPAEQGEGHFSGVHAYEARYILENADESRTDTG